MKSNTQMILDVCTNESCIDVGRKFLTPLSLSREWHFPVLSTAATTCKRFTNPGTGSLVCSGCYTSGKKISGYYFRTYQYAALHLSRTDDTLQIAANVTTMTSTSVLTVDISKGSGVATRVNMYCDTLSFGILRRGMRFNEAKSPMQYHHSLEPWRH